eukprot:203224_1
MTATQHAIIQQDNKLTGQRKKRDKIKERKQIEDEISKKYQQEVAKLKQEMQDANLAKQLHNEEILEEYTLLTDDLLQENSKLNILRQQLQHQLNLKTAEIDKLLDKYQQILEQQNDELWDGDGAEEVWVEMDESFDEKEEGENYDVIYGAQYHANKKYQRYSVSGTI